VHRHDTYVAAPASTFRHPGRVALRLNPRMTGVAAAARIPGSPVSIPRKTKTRATISMCATGPHGRPAFARPLHSERVT